MDDEENNWFQKAASGVGDFLEDAADLVGDVFSSVSESVSELFTGKDVPEFLSGLVDSDGPAGGQSDGPARLGLDYGYKADSAEKKGWNDTFKGFVKDNQKSLLEMGFGAVVGMAKASAAKDAAKYKAQADSAMLVQKDNLEQAANKRFSDSIGGLKPVKKYAPKPLTRLDGSRVFTPTGLINTGAK